MSSTVLYMSMSLDGFITGPNVRPDNGLGDGGERLHEWLFGDEGIRGVNRQIYNEFMSTGAVHRRVSRNRRVVAELVASTSRHPLDAHANRRGDRGDPEA